MKGQEFGALVLLAAIWGISFLLIDIAAPVLGAIVLVAARMLIASGALMLYVVATHRPRPALRGSWKAYLVLGALNSALPLTLEALAVVQLTPALTAILATTAPLFTALAAVIWLGERLTLSKSAGLLLGLFGVGVLVGWSSLPLTVAVIGGILSALLASLSYALGGIYARVTFRGTPALSLAIGQELFAGLLLVPLALASPPASVPALPVVTATVTLALVMTAGGNLLYFYLIDRIGPTKTQTVSFLIPVFALLASVLFLDEPMTAGTLLGLGIIFGSVALVTEARLRRTVPTPESQPVHRLLVSGAVTNAPAASPTSSRPIGAWAAITMLVYDRHSTRRDRANRRPAMCV